MKMDAPTIAVLIGMVTPMLVFCGAVFLERWRTWRHQKPPQSDKLLRPPGYSITRKLDACEDGILKTLMVGSAVGMSGGLLAYVVGTVFGSGNRSFGWLMFGVSLVPAGFTCVIALRAFRQVQGLRNLRLGLSGEQAVAEALHEAADAGYRIFHDLDTGRIGNLDHIAIGPRGVFLIETKARRRHGSRNGKPAHEVTYDGKGLEFPSHYDTKTIPQAARNAEWLAQRLTKVTALPVTVQPVVALPGWYVQTKGNFPVKVMNAAYLAKYLRSQGVVLDDKQVQRIIAWLDDQCRDVEF